MTSCCAASRDRLALEGAVNDYGANAGLRCHAVLSDPTETETNCVCSLYAHHRDWHLGCLCVHGKRAAAFATALIKFYDEFHICLIDDQSRKVCLARDIDGWVFVWPC